MLRKIENKEMGRSNLGWLNSIFHFSFAEYYDFQNMSFGNLRVLNDDLIEKNTGFDKHPHRNMEIISYVVKGELTHEDSMGHKNTIKRGDVQYMSAGTGVFHSEHNLGSETLRLLQIWILPDKNGYNPAYGDCQFAWEERENKWLHMVSSKEGIAPIKVNQDINIYSLELEKEREISFPINNGRQLYLVQVEGCSSINTINMKEKDAMEITEEDIFIKTKETSHFIVIEMLKG